MRSDYIRQTLLFVLLVLLQVLVLRQIHFLTYATPFLYIYFIIQLPIKFNRNMLLILAFILGFTLDLLCHTPGLNASATVLIAFLRKPLQGLFFTREDFDYIKPRIATIGAKPFIGYAAAMIFIHHSLLILMESFSTHNIEVMVIRILCSSILTLILVVGIEGLAVKKKR